MSDQITVTQAVTQVTVTQGGVIGAGGGGGGGVPEPHASSHAAGQYDEITPASIGAATAAQAQTLAQQTAALDAGLSAVIANVGEIEEQLDTVAGTVTGLASTARVDGIESRVEEAELRLDGVDQTFSLLAYASDVQQEAQQRQAEDVALGNRIGGVEGALGAMTQGFNAALTGKADKATTYTRTESDARYRPIAYVPAWTDITGRPAFATVATSGAYADLTGAPTLGTAATLDVPATAGATASAGQVVRGDDPRLASTGGITQATADGRYAARTGPTSLGVVASLSVGDGTTTSSTRVFIDTAAGVTRGLLFRTAGVDRWLFSVNTTAEAGANAGSNWQLARYADDGALLGTVLLVLRSNGAITYNGNGLTLQTGDLTLTAGGVIFGAASPTIRMGSNGLTFVSSGGANRWGIDGSGHLGPVGSNGALFTQAATAATQTAASVSLQFPTATNNWIVPLNGTSSISLATPGSTPASVSSFSTGRVRMTLILRNADTGQPVATCTVASGAPYRLSTSHPWTTLPVGTTRAADFAWENSVWRQVTPWTDTAN